MGIVYPDVEVVTTSVTDPMQAGTVETLTPATVTLPPPVRVRIPTIEIREATRNRLVTCIEILSYAKKRQPGLEQYLQKRSRLIQTGVHLVEIDLIRRGARPLPLAPA